MLFKYLSRLISLAVLGWVCRIFLVNTNLGLFDFFWRMETVPFIAITVLRNGRSHKEPSLLTLRELEASAYPSVAYLVSEHYHVPPLTVTLRTMGNPTLRWKKSRRLNRSHPHCLTLETVCYPSNLLAPFPLLELFYLWNPMLALHNRDFARISAQRQKSSFQ